MPDCDLRNIYEMSSHSPINTDVSAFDQHGYVVLENFKTSSECEKLRAGAHEIIDGFDASHHREIFSTNNGDADRADYFLGSANTVRCFFEEEAFDEDGTLKQDKHLSINKIGHAMHDLIPGFYEFSHGDELATLATALGIERSKIWQSMYIFKQPRIGGEVAWHQDATYFYSDPISVITFWFAIDDAHLDNGCLWVSREGAQSPLREKFIVEGGTARTQALDDTPWPATDHAIPIEVRAGTLVCFNGLLPHYSAPNRSASARHAYTLHVVDATTTYAPTNWIQRPDNFPPRGFNE